MPLYTIDGIAPRLPAPGQEIVLLVDEGIYYFDLRAIYIRGTVQPGPPPAGGVSLPWAALSCNMPPRDRPIRPEPPTRKISRRVRPSERSHTSLPS